MRGDDAEHRIGHAGQLVVVGEVAGTDDADRRLVHAALDELLGEQAGLEARKVHEQGVRLVVAGALQERREIGIGERHPHRFDDLGAALEGAFLEGGLRFEAGRPVVDDGDDLLRPVLHRPVGDGRRRLAQGEARAHHVGRALDGDRCTRHQHDRRNFRLGRERRDRERRRRDADAHDGDFLVDDQVLGEPLRGIRRCRIILGDDLDLAAGHGVAVLLEIELDAIHGGLAGGVEGAGQRLDQTELEHLLRIRRAQARADPGEACDDGEARGSPCMQHGDPSLVGIF